MQSCSAKQSPTTVATVPQSRPTRTTSESNGHWGRSPHNSWAGLPWRVWPCNKSPLVDPALGRLRDACCSTTIFHEELAPARQPQNGPGTRPSSSLRSNWQENRHVPLFLCHVGGKPIKAPTKVPALPHHALAQALRCLKEINCKLMQPVRVRANTSRHCS